MDASQQEALRLRYLANQIETASPIQRLLMLFDQLGRDLHAAGGAFERAELKVINDSLLHAQEIIFALQDPLDTATPLGQALHGVYAFCIAKLIDANLRKDPRPLAEVVPLIARIASANRAAAVAYSEELSRAV